MTQPPLTSDDRLEIMACVTNMALFADLHEWDNFMSMYAPTITVDYTSIYGGEPMVLNVASAMGMWAKQLAWWDATQHLVSNLHIVGDQNEATARSHVRAIHIKDSKPWIFGGLYTHKLHRTDERWRISSQKVDRRYEENADGPASPKPAWLEAIS